MKTTRSAIMALAFATHVCAFLSPAPRRGSFVPKKNVAVSAPLLHAPHFFSSSVSVSSAASDNEIDLLGEVDAIFDSIDVNQDGAISNEELSRHLIDTMGYSVESARYLFAALDMDTNGDISREEMRFAFSSYGAVALYMTFGLGGGEMTDGTCSDRIKHITKRSLLDPESRNKLLLDDLADLIFDLIDIDQSGEIDKHELRDHFETVATKQVNTDSQAKEYVDTMFSVLDLNSDGVIAREEMRDAFKQYDFRFLYETLGLPAYTNRSTI